MRARSWPDERGISSVEVLVAVILFVTIIMGAAAAASASNRVIASTWTANRFWAAVQYQSETLMMQGYDGVTSGAATVSGYPMTWTVGGTSPKRIELVANRDNDLGQAMQDTVVLYMLPPGP